MSKWNIFIDISLKLNLSEIIALQMHYQQQHIRQILECKQIDFEEVDISDPHHKEDKTFMQSALRLQDEELATLPPQIFKQQQYCGVSQMMEFFWHF